MTRDDLDRAVTLLDELDTMTGELGKLLTFKERAANIDVSGAAGFFYVDELGNTRKVTLESHDDVMTLIACALRLITDRRDERRNTLHGMGVEP